VEQDPLAEGETVDEEAFTWSWNTPAADDNSNETSTDEAAPPVDDESGVLIETDEPNEQVDGAADLTEVEILDDSPGVSDVVADDDGITTGESAGDEPAPDTGEVDDLLTSPDDEIESQETLAAWATQWNTPTDSAETRGDEQTREPGSDTADDEVAEEPNDEEDTVSKAERLIGELRAIIPTLARPKPAQPALSCNPETLASDLDNAAKLGAWDDLRQILLDARDAPRDIDNMLKLASNVDQMLELLDDRNNLAKTANNVAALLRKPADGSGEL
jgi:hypothetical protein